jgi:hypothetical protein
MIILEAVICPHGTLQDKCPYCVLNELAQHMKGQDFDLRRLEMQFESVEMKRVVDAAMQQLQVMKVANERPMDGREALLEQAIERVRSWMRHDI